MSTIGQWMTPEQREKEFREYVREKRKQAAISVALWFAAVVALIAIGAGLLYLAARVVRLAWGS